MSNAALILLGSLLVNNFVLAQFLGLCPFMGVTQSRHTAMAMALATTFVLTLSAAMGYTMFHFVLQPLGLEYLRIIGFIVAIAGVVQFTELFLRSVSPLLHQVLGIYLPLITTNCAVLAVALLAIDDNLTFTQTLAFAVGAALGFVLVMVLFAAIRERIDGPWVPNAFRGTPIALVSAGIMALGFMGFAGLA